MEELARLLQRIEGVRRDIAALRPADVQRVHLPAATDELDAIIVATEGATQTILDAAEKISAAVPASGDVGSKVNEQVMRIFEACTFQDITGQRVTKVIRTMKEVEQVVSESL